MADGVFIPRPAVAMTQLIPEVAAENGAIIVEKNLATSVPGVFAAGDLAGGAPAGGQGRRRGQCGGAVRGQLPAETGPEVKGNP